MAVINDASVRHAEFLGDGTTVAFTLPEPAEHLNHVYQLAAGASAGATNDTTTVTFAGSIGDPANTVTYATAPTTGSLIFVEYIPAGAL